MRQSKNSWMTLWGSLGFKKRQNKGQKQRKRVMVRPRFESLEDRQLMAGDFRIDPVTVAESATTAVFAVTRENDTSGPATVEFRTIDGTAKAGEDYSMVSGSLAFGPGEASKTISVPILAGTKPVVEVAESFVLQLSNPQYATISRGEALGTITDDDAILVVGPDADTDGNSDNREVKVFSSTGAYKYQFYPYGTSYSAGVRVTAADFNNDGVPDIVTAPGVAPAKLKIFDGASNGTVVLYEFDPYGGSVGNMYVAAGDVTNDGRADLIVSAGNHVKIINGATLSNANDPPALGQYLAFHPNSGDIRLAVADINGDGQGDVVAAEGPRGYSSRVWVYSGYSADTIAQFTPYNGNFGVYVAAGDLDGDGRAEIITGPGASGGPHIKVWDTSNFSTERNGFFAYDPNFGGGARVSAGDVTGDGVAEIITGAGPGGGPHVKVLTSTGTELFGLFGLTPSFGGGIYVEGEGSQARGHIKIIDNGPLNFSAAGSFTSTTGGFGNDQHTAPAGTGTSTATWTFTGLQSGRYRISTTWGSASAEFAPFTITSGSTVVSATVDQRAAPNHLQDANAWWHDLGGQGATYLVGTSLTVQLTNAANGTVSADAVRIERLHGLATPVVVTTTAPLAYLENSGPVDIDAGLSITDADSATLASAATAITAGYVVGQDSLSYTLQPGITATYSIASGRIDFVGQGSLAAYQAVLRSVRYWNTSSNPTGSSRQVQFTVNGELGAFQATRTIQIIANESPTIVNASPSGVVSAGGTHGPYTFQEKTKGTQLVSRAKNHCGTPNSALRR